jgi:acetyltransferase-like isoleucine patch superfamily enzyme
MSIVQRVARGEGPFWAATKRGAKRILQFHIPANGLARPFFRGCYRMHVFIREGLAWALRFCWYEPLFRSQCQKVGPRFRMEQLPYLTGKGDIVVGSGVRLSGKSSFCFNNRQLERPQIIIGDNTFIGHNSALIAGHRIEIGRDCLIAGGVRIADQDGHPTDAERRRAGEPTPAEQISPVVVGNDVWIGSGALILKGVRIGDRAIVAGRAVVTRDVEPDTIVAGNPARVVKDLSVERQTTQEQR